ncbi:hypothetical protein LJC20_04455 [Eubacteriales bacterium OttesenSCG-928-M02]|nr:hypothetical protein [Eubacteriales bacterium OttesenSCG-928-M02]
MVDKCLIKTDQICTGCGECDMCEYERKLCDNCFSCLDMEGTDFREIRIDAILMEEEPEEGK